MARGAITPYVVTRAGLDVSTVTATVGVPADGHKVINRPGTWVEVENTNGAATARTVTFSLSGGKDGQTIAPRTKSIAAGKTFKIGPFPPEMYGGSLLIDVDHAELEIAAYVLQF